MEKVGAYEVKTHISKLLDKVSKGVEFTITRHGVPVAKLVPYNRTKNKNIQKTIKDMEAFQKEHSLNEMSIREMIDEGRS